MKQILKNIVLFTILGAAYIGVEILYRGYTHWTMFLLGGVCGFAIGSINEYIPWEMSLPK